MTTVNWSSKHSTPLVELGYLEFKADTSYIFSSRNDFIFSASDFCSAFSDFFHRYNEAYTWTNPTCCVHNVIIGKLWIEQYGTVEIVNHR